MLKVGLIGCGVIGRIHASCYGTPGSSVTLAAAADVMPERAKNIAERFGCEVYSSGMELIENSDVDIIDICIPTYMHTSHAVAAMKKGRHVFIEKPVCLSLDEADLLVKAQKETGVFVQIGQVLRFWDEYMWLKQTADNETYGKLKSAVFSRLSAAPKWSWENWYADCKKSGSVVLDLHIHDIDFVRYLMGEPQKITANASRDEKGEIQQIFAAYDYGDMVVTAEGCWDYPADFPFCASYRAKFEKATAVYDGGTLTVYMADGTRFVPEFGDGSSYDYTGYCMADTGPYYRELKYFTDCIEKGVAPVKAPLSEGIKSVMLALEEIKLTGGVMKK